MKKFIVLLAVILGVSISVSAHTSNCVNTGNGPVSITSMDNEEFVCHVTATNIDGSLNEYFTVFRRRLPGGKYRYFVKFSGEELTVFWASEYRCFAVQANVLWFFSSKSLNYEFFSAGKRAYNA
ncbi:MAG: hypothetical protein J6J64_01065 [Alistipes sp.]|nr:hypothetical protein [Alistipes sp.]